jgi:hypothetical protein
MMEEVRVLSPTGTLGYGFNKEAFQRAMAQNPDVIAVDAGSTDPGPYYLGAGKPLVSAISTKLEIETMLLAAMEKRIPLIIGSAGGAGGKPHVEWTLEIVREISKEHNLHYRMAVIDSEIDKDLIIDKIQRGEVMAFESGKALSPEDVKKSTRIVAQMGVEPIIKALEMGASVIITGRSCDDAVIAAYPIYKGFDRGLALHMGKILECGAFAAVPFAMDVMLGYLREDHFLLEPGSLRRRCTVPSVAGHSLYEREDPYVQGGPGGTLDLNGVHFDQHDDRKVKVSGSVFLPSEYLSFKIEGAVKIGYRTISVAGVRCPTMINKIDDILSKIKKMASGYFPGDGDYTLLFHLYGKDGVMGSLEFSPITSHELGLVTEVVAHTQELANAICHFVTGTILHHSYEGQLNTAGNLAFLYSPSEIDAGEVYVFSVYHLMKAEDPFSLFPVTIF